jgi:5-methylcytosine-specific restriction protein A
MPDAALRPCRTCGVVKCTQHVREHWQHRQPVQRIRGRKLQQMRQRLFQQQPLCVLCLQHGRHALATIRDHIIPLAEGGLDLESNTQPLCQACSDAKTQREADRGKARGGVPNCR